MIIISTLDDPQYLATEQQDFGFDGGAASIADPEYLEVIQQTGGYTRISFVPPEALSFVIRQQNDEFIDVDFGATMKDDANLVDPASYALAPAGGIGVPVSISGVTRLNPTTIRLEVSLGTNNQPYQFTVVGGVRLATGESIIGAGAAYLAEVLPPTVTAARATSSTTVEVTFSRPMTSNADLVDPTKYRFTDGLFAAAVERTGAATVVVTTSKQIEGVTYALRVFP
jgi:hypothetical protein